MARARKRKCPQCGLGIYHLASDRFRACHRCGWTAGYPLLRWFTHPKWLRYYSRRLRDSWIGPYWLTVRIVLIVVITAMLVVAGVPVFNSAGDIVSGASGVDVPKIDLTTDTSLNVSRAERLTFEETNERRVNNSVGAVEYSRQLSMIARRHSEDMAKHDYIGHTEPDGDTVFDRLRTSPNPCSEYTNPRFAHGENAGSAYWRARFRVYGTEEPIVVNEESELADALVTAWMNSKRHRQNMLYNEWRMVGIGIAINESTGQVYATQLFC